MGWRKQFELRNERIEYIRNLLRERTKSGKDYFIQELVNETIEYLGAQWSDICMNILKKRFEILKCH